MSHLSLMFKFSSSILGKVHFATNLCLRVVLKAHCREADRINKTIKKKRIRQDSVISLYIEIHEDDNDLIPFVLKTKYDSRS